MRWILVAFLLTGPAAPGATAPAPQGFSTVRVEVPPVLSFEVTNATPGTIVLAVPVPFRVTFSQASLPGGQALRISVKADGTLILPGGTSVPISNLAWTTSQAVNGVGVNGALSENTFNPVYESRAGARAGRVDLSWSLSVPAGITRAGTGQVMLRWKFEHVTP